MIGRTSILAACLLGLLMGPTPVAAEDQTFTYALSTPSGTPGLHGCGAMPGPANVMPGDVCWGDVALAGGVDAYTVTLTDAVWGDRVAYEVCWIAEGDPPSCAHFGHQILPLRCRGTEHVTVPEEAATVIVHIEASFKDLDGPCGASTGTLVATA